MHSESNQIYQPSAASSRVVMSKPSPSTTTSKSSSSLARSRALVTSSSSARGTTAAAAAGSGSSSSLAKVSRMRGLRDIMMSDFSYHCLSTVNDISLSDVVQMPIPQHLKDSMPEPYRRRGPRHFVGVVRYIGGMSDSDPRVKFLGLELCEPIGDSDGSQFDIVAGTTTRFFRTPPNRGVFLSVKNGLRKLDSGVLLLTLNESLQNLRMKMNEVSELNSSLKKENFDLKKQLRQMHDSLVRFEVARDRYASTVEHLTQTNRRLEAELDKEKALAAELRESKDQLYSVGSVAASAATVASTAASVTANEIKKLAGGSGESGMRRRVGDGGTSVRPKSHSHSQSRAAGKHGLVLQDRASMPIKPLSDDESDSKEHTQRSKGGSGKSGGKKTAKGGGGSAGGGSGSSSPLLSTSGKGGKKHGRRKRRRGKHSHSSDEEERGGRRRVPSDSSSSASDDSTSADDRHRRKTRRRRKRKKRRTHSSDEDSERDRDMNSDDDNEEPKVSKPRQITISKSAVNAGVKITETDGQIKVEIIPDHQPSTGSVSRIRASASSDGSIARSPGIMLTPDDARASSFAVQPPIVSRKQDGGPFARGPPIMSPGIVDPRASFDRPLYPFARGPNNRAFPHTTRPALSWQHSHTAGGGPSAMVPAPRITQGRAGSFDAPRVVYRTTHPTPGLGGPGSVPISQQTRLPHTLRSPDPMGRQPVTATPTTLAVKVDSQGVDADSPSPDPEEKRDSMSADDRIARAAVSSSSVSPGNTHLGGTTLSAEDIAGGMDDDDGSPFVDVHSVANDSSLSGDEPDKTPRLPAERFVSYDGNDDLAGLLTPVGSQKKKSKKSQDRSKQSRKEENDEMMMMDEDVELEPSVIDEDEIVHGSMRVSKKPPVKHEKSGHSTDSITSSMYSKPSPRLGDDVASHLEPKPVSSDDNLTEEELGCDDRELSARSPTTKKRIIAHAKRKERKMSEQALRDKTRRISKHFEKAREKSIMKKREAAKRSSTVSSRGTISSMGSSTTDHRLSVDSAQSSQYNSRMRIAVTPPALAEGENSNTTHEDSAGVPLSSHESSPTDHEIDGESDELGDAFEGTTEQLSQQMRQVGPGRGSAAAAGHRARDSATTPIGRMSYGVSTPPVIRDMGPPPSKITEVSTSLEEESWSTRDESPMPADMNEDEEDDEEDGRPPPGVDRRGTVVRRSGSLELELRDHRSNQAEMASPVGMDLTPIPMDDISPTPPRIDTSGDEREQQSKSDGNGRLVPGGGRSGAAAAANDGLQPPEGDESFDSIIMVTPVGQDAPSYETAEMEEQRRRAEEDDRRAFAEHDPSDREDEEMEEIRAPPKKQGGAGAGSSSSSTKTESASGTEKRRSSAAAAEAVKRLSIVIGDDPELDKQASQSREEDSKQEEDAPLPLKEDSEEPSKTASTTAEGVSDEFVSEESVPLQEPEFERVPTLTDDPIFTTQTPLDDETRQSMSVKRRMSNVKLAGVDEQGHGFIEIDTPKFEASSEDLTVAPSRGVSSIILSDIGSEEIIEKVSKPKEDEDGADAGTTQTSDETADEKSKKEKDDEHDDADETGSVLVVPDETEATDENTKNQTENGPESSDHLRSETALTDGDMELELSEDALMDLEWTMSADKAAEEAADSVSATASGMMSGGDGTVSGDQGMTIKKRKKKSRHSRKRSSKKKKIDPSLLQSTPEERESWEPKTWKVYKRTYAHFYPEAWKEHKKQMSSGMSADLARKAMEAELSADPEATAYAELEVAARLSGGPVSLSGVGVAATESGTASMTASPAGPTGMAGPSTGHYPGMESGGWQYGSHMYGVPPGMARGPSSYTSAYDPSHNHHASSVSMYGGLSGSTAGVGSSAAIGGGAGDVPPPPSRHHVGGASVPHLAGVYGGGAMVGGGTHHVSGMPSMTGHMGGARYSAGMAGVPPPPSSSPAPPPDQRAHYAQSQTYSWGAYGSRRDLLAGAGSAVGSTGVATGATSPGGAIEPPPAPPSMHESQL